MVSYASALTKDGRKRAPRPLFGVNIVKPFPWVRVVLGLGAVAFLTRREYNARYQVSPRDQFLRKVVVVPYGVLGMQMTLQGGLVRAGSEPDESTFIVDPANLRHIFTTAVGATGASGAIYNMLGLRGPFPDEVVQAISRVCDTKFYKYGERANVIHVVDPDFREGAWSEREAAVELSRAYRNVFHEFVRGDGDVLRVPPLSSGVLSGSLYNQLPIITQSAVAMAFEQLHTFDREYLLRRDKQVELCVFMNREWDMYQNVFKNCTQPSKL
ncbi:uncharacterized protein TEOVI_000434000 [Trypanosoma equiperdum]|uniref:Macro domain-containing protein n=4 Tax=Trypanozoon TaxID=39700 RepID=Q383R5_TRYB2|nr:hypothetical protein, conserved [Trypanosoma brucei gambiense DAL972]XP_829078.1 hypothetical protein, conserved [Trypanosoma brucei brucei TREU927]RHW67440.1 hypothetical protein DPX39_110073000 [Trypanosoma brucei equiperdum]SCU72762.1 hypothetical protein, conserved [Trypanosoma equiperdum]EAN79966.1 hypothetical protein, conserved [Trypanosoma brucei brucei TREU927]CBH18020.1 hypothetical protein, conserved [Trypanosoma brucei gambiense DAL972]|eukprot:XP_011780284.1 hypothetical protein, conserved [Trypanosoma brucei gambiense DAL972]